MEQAETAENVLRPEPHVLFVIVGDTQHAFEMESRVMAISHIHAALEHGFVEIDNDKVYLLAGGPKAGTVFLVMSKTDVMEQQLAAQKARTQAGRTQLIRPQ